MKFIPNLTAAAMVEEGRYNVALKRQFAGSSVANSETDVR